MSFSYVVHASFDDEEVLEEWIGWLRHGHIAEVLASGAHAAQLIRLDGEAAAAEVRYCFTSREAFAQYERTHAPRLRAEGMAIFPPERGIRYFRSTGAVAFEA